MDVNSEAEKQNGVIETIADVVEPVGLKAN